MQCLELDACISRGCPPWRIDPAEDAHSAEHSRNFVRSKNRCDAISAWLAELAEVYDCNLDARVQHRAPEGVDAVAEDRWIMYTRQDQSERRLVDTKRSQLSSGSRLGRLRHPLFASEHEALDRRFDRSLRETFRQGIRSAVDASEEEPNELDGGRGSEIEQSKATAEQAQHGEALAKLEGCVVAARERFRWQFHQQGEQRRRFREQIRMGHSAGRRARSLERSPKSSGGMLQVVHDRGNLSLFGVSEDRRDITRA